MAGLEPASEGVKVPCLTTWLHPCVWLDSESQWRKKRGPEPKLRPERLRMGWVKGLEPSTPGTTIRCSNQLSYTHHIADCSQIGSQNRGPSPCQRTIQLERIRGIQGRTTPQCPEQNCSDMARLKGLEPLTHCLEGSCSIHLSYRRIWSG